MELSKSLANRYSSIIKSIHPEAVAKQNTENPSSMEHLLWMCDQVLNNDKIIISASRWTGFVQGTLVTLGIINLNDDINFIHSNSKDALIELSNKSMKTILDGDTKMELEEV